MDANKKLLEQETCLYAKAVAWVEVQLYMTSDLKCDDASLGKRKSRGRREVTKAVEYDGILRHRKSNTSVAHSCFLCPILHVKTNNRLFLRPGLGNAFSVKCY